MKKALYFLLVAIFEPSFSVFGTMAIITVSQLPMTLWLKVVIIFVAFILSGLIQGALGIPTIIVKGKNHIKII